MTFLCGSQMSPPLYERRKFPIFLIVLHGYRRTLLLFHSIFRSTFSRFVRSFTFYFSRRYAARKMGRFFEISARTFTFSFDFSFDFGPRLRRGFTFSPQSGEKWSFLVTFAWLKPRNFTFLSHFLVHFLTLFIASYFLADFKNLGF